MMHVVDCCRIKHLIKTVENMNQYTIFDQNQNWVEWTTPSVSLSQTKVNDINLNDRPQMQNDTENEIGRSVFPFIHGLRIDVNSIIYINHML